MMENEVGVSAREAGAALGVSRAFIIGSDCPRHRYQGNGPKGRPLLMFYLSEVRAWWSSRELRPHAMRKAG